jgi:dihydroorotase
LFKYMTTPPYPDQVIATVKNGKLHEPLKSIRQTGRTIVKGGLVVDPANQIEAVKDIAFAGCHIEEVADQIKPVKGDKIINAEGLWVVPGLVDLHVHMHGLYEVSTRPSESAAEDGVTVALSPDTANSTIGPAVIGAELDRGMLLNIGQYVGIHNLTVMDLSFDEIVAFYKGELAEDVALQRAVRVPITVKTAPFVVGLKDNHNYWICSDETYDQGFEFAEQVGLIFMSHCQDPDHLERMMGIAQGRHMYLGHASAAGCGTFADPIESIQKVIDACKQDNITGEFLSVHLRAGLGNREGLSVDEEAQQLMFEALQDGVVDIIGADGQSDATMKGFGDTRDHIPCLVELVERGILPLSKSIATLTSNPVKYAAKVTREDWWTKELGHLGVGARANITIIDKHDKLATYTICNGQITAFENRIVRKSHGAGGLVTKYGIIDNLGIGDMPMFGYAVQ